MQVYRTSLSSITYFNKIINEVVVVEFQAPEDVVGDSGSGKRSVK